jgi:IS1 family transposase
MNKLTTIERAQVLTSLVEGNSIASTCRMFGVNKITVLRLLADAGTFAADFHDLTVNELATKRIQLDEIWSFCHTKVRNLKVTDWGKGYGDVWCWVSIDADSKLAINWHVGGRDQGEGTRFLTDLASRLTDRVQLTTDGHAAYFQSVKRAFGDNVDYGMLIKHYANNAEGGSGGGRYSPPICIGATKSVVTGNPDQSKISTSYSERQNLTMRMQMRRFTRLTNGFSKRLENHKHAIALHFVYYNFIRVHQTIKTTPAVAVGIASKPMTMVDFVMMLEREEELLGGRLTDYKPTKIKIK